MSDTSAPTQSLPESEVARIGKALVDDIPDAVIYVDPDNIIRLWNAGATRIFGFSASEAVGRSLDIIIPERLRKRHADGFRHMMETGQRRHKADEVLSVPALNKSGETLSIQFTVAAVTNDDRSVAGIVAVLRDATQTFRELKRLRSLVSEPSRS